MARKIKTMDGNSAAAHVAYAYSELAAIYPITPSSVMAELVDKQSAAGRKNLFGQEVTVVEMQSEAGVAGAVHGSLQGGALTSTFTASQGLLLMIPNMYKMAGELLPCVMHVSARTLATHALSIFGDHSDIYACRQTGFAMLAATNPQEVMDLAAVAHCAAIKARVPFLHFFDGFRTSHEINKVAVWSDEDLLDMLDQEAVSRFRSRALNPNHPVQRGTAQNPDVFFQAREAANSYYNAVPGIVEEYLDKVNAKTGSNYKLFNYYGAPDAEHILVAMGSVNDTIEETIDYLNAQGGKFGLVKVRLYRPFVRERFVAEIPSTAKTISVLDRTKEPGALGEPLMMDVVMALKGTAFETTPVLGGRYGLGSKDTTPAQIIAVCRNAQGEKRREFTIGIEDDVTNLSLPITENPNTAPPGTTCCKFWGLGADGTVGANKNSIKIIGDNTGMQAQAYFAYDSKKSGGVTISHLRFGNQQIKSSYLIEKADFVACHCPAYIDRYDMVQEVVPGGTFLLNCGWDVEELGRRLPGDAKAYIANNNIKLYTIDGVSIARELGLGGRINTILQAAFFKLAGVIPPEEAVRYMKEAATAAYSKKGDAVVQMNHAAIDRGMEGVVQIEIPEDWKTAQGGIPLQVAKGENQTLVDYVNEILVPVSAQKGDSIPVSAFLERADGTVPMGSAAYEKRGIAVDVPRWLPENCIQCNFCSFVCSHAVIRPAVMTEAEAAAAPAGMKKLPMTGAPGYQLSMTLSALDCTGCGACVAVCPGKKGNKALTMESLESQLEQQECFAYGFSLPEKPEILEKFKASTVKGSQFRQPLLEYSGACAGCGETPYAKLVTQLYGDRMYIANATGCSSIWGASNPATPYTVNKKGEGPAWANSLFEDNAEFGYGIYLAQATVRRGLLEKVRQLCAQETGEEFLRAAQRFLETAEDTGSNKEAAEALLPHLEKLENPLAGEILANKDFLGKKSVWMFGGDGWAYDIGFGGLDHVLASGENVNILVFDTEVYSNTGGQSSKATPTGAVAQFASAGKETRKKDLGVMAMSYGNVYVAKVAMGADYAQCVRAITEAENYKGPSLIIAYATCISHGIKGGMSQGPAEMKRAVEAGYWINYRYNPAKAQAGENPFTLDSPVPTADYKGFIQNEVRYSALQRSFPDRAEQLFRKAADGAQEKYAYLQRLEEVYRPEPEEKE